MWKNGFNWLFRPSRIFSAFLDLNWPKIRSKTHKNDPKSQILIFSSKIHAQYLRLCGKVALFGSLGLSIPIWPFGLILDLFGPIYPKEAGGPQLFFGPLDFTYP